MGAGDQTERILLMKAYSLFAWSTGITLLIYLAGAMWALVTKEITFSVFIAAVAVPLSGMSGWAAKSASVPPPEKLLS